VCAAHCPEGALLLKGRWTFVEEVVARARRLEPFFRHSGGGVTLTGGEVTAQPDFATAVLRGCRETGIHTAIETSGACGWSRLEPLAELSDLVLYDLKLMDPQAHRRWTGFDNHQILRNAAMLAIHSDVIVRVPLIPDITDTDLNLIETFHFMQDVGLRRVDLLAYNPSSAAKYEWLGLNYPLTDLQPQTPERLRALRTLAYRAGVEVV
jgi:pyruvate formate lyase activating enzyme